jgi:hypothetical protein
MEVQMDTRLTRVAGLMLGLSLLGSGAAAASAQSVVGAVPLQSSVAVPGTGAGLDAAPYQLAALQTLAQAQDPTCEAEGSDAATAAEDPNDADNIQDQNGADDAAEGDTGAENPNDTDSLQCGDQNETDGSAQ